MERERQRGLIKVKDIKKEDPLVAIKVREEKFKKEVRHFLQLFALFMQPAIMDTLFIVARQSGENAKASINYQKRNGKENEKTSQEEA